MNFITLEYFLVAAEELNFTQAAKRLYITQQALSTHIRNLEEELGVELFERGKPLTLTYAGTRAVKYANAIIHMKQQMKVELQDIRSEKGGALRIGINNSRGAALFPYVLPRFQKEHPSVEVHMIDGNAYQLEEQLIREELDFVIGLRPNNIDLQEIILRTEYLVMLVPDTIMKQLFPGNVEQMRRKMQDKLDIAVFAKAPFVLLDNQMTIRAVSERFLRKYKVSPLAVCETSSIETMLALAVAGIGIVFSTESLLLNVKDMLQDKTKCPLDIFVLKDPETLITLGVYYHKNHYLTRAARDFIRYVDDFYSNNQIDYESLFRKGEKNGIKRNYKGI